MRRYSAILILIYEQFAHSATRLMERRMVSVESKSAEDAYDLFMKIGRASEVRKNKRTKTNFSLIFIGLQEMIELGVEASPHEVWHEVSRVKWPLVRRNAVRHKEDLAVFDNS